MSHQIPNDTWRGRVARVLESDSWKDCHEVSEELSASERIDYRISENGASSVLSDMMRHDDVVRREVSRGQIQYEYRLREDAIVS